jgi:hypothetical protein
MPTVIRPVRTARKTTRTCNDIRLALALRHSSAPLPPPVRYDKCGGIEDCDETCEGSTK